MLGTRGYPGQQSDAAGYMACRAPSSTTSCSASPQTGAQMTYDAERRLASWASPSGTSPATTALYLYDGGGNRVEQRVSTVAGGGTNTLYVGGGSEEYTSNWSSNSSSHTTYYSVPGLPAALSVNGTYSYLATDGLGSVSEALDGNGNVTATQLYAPYGGVRYSSGTLPTAKGFTGQRADAASGLDYYNARYYDPALGQFTSGDSDPKGGVNRYAYVRGMVETATDPTGHRYSCGPGCTPPPPPPPPNNPPTVVSTTTSGPVTNTTTNSDFSTTTTTTRIETITYSDGTVKTIPMVTSSTTCNSTCQAERADRAHADLLKMVVGGAGVVAGITAIFLTLMNWESLAAQATVAFIFGGNPLAALLAEIGGTLLAASYFLSNLDDYLQMTGRGGSSFDQQVDQLRVEADALSIVSFTVAAATSLTSGVFATLDGSLPALGGALNGVLAVSGGWIGDDVSQQLLTTDQADQ